MHFVPELLVKRGAPLAIVWRAAHGQLKGVSKRDRERVRLLGSPAHPNPEANPVAMQQPHAAAMQQPCSSHAAVLEPDSFDRACGYPGAAGRDRPGDSRPSRAAARSELELAY